LVTLSYPAANYESGTLCEGSERISKLDGVVPKVPNIASTTFSDWATVKDSDIQALSCSRLLPGQGQGQRQGASLDMVL
jgi:hypothetical protein